MSTEHADLDCEVCSQITPHELHYAGRLLESTRCQTCGTHLEVSARQILPDYVHDLEQRVVSKPGRMLHRAAQDPLGFVWSLPGKVIAQPGKFWREFKALFGR